MKRPVLNVFQISLALAAVLLVAGKTSALIDLSKSSGNHVSEGFLLSFYSRRARQGVFP